MLLFSVVLVLVYVLLDLFLHDSKYLYGNLLTADIVKGSTENIFNGIFELSCALYVRKVGVLKIQNILICWLTHKIHFFE